MVKRMRGSYGARALAARVTLILVLAISLATQTIHLVPEISGTPYSTFSNAAQCDRLMWAPIGTGCGGAESARTGLAAPAGCQPVEARPASAKPILLAVCAPSACRAASTFLLCRQLLI